jgi:uncharacterized protein YfiM (DUF2279 family)
MPQPTLIVQTCFLSTPFLTGKSSVKKTVVFCLLLFSFLPTLSGFAQDSLNTTPIVNKKRLTALTVTGSALYGATWVGLHEAWYKSNMRRSFHFFDDHAQWQQIDKLGHFYSTYHLSHTSAQMFRWTGLPHRKSVWLGSLTGLLLMLPVEVLDGFSNDYGASWSDIVANTSGAALSLQNLWWRQPRIHPKFSFHQTGFARLRPNTLGENLPQQVLKDYNGQTYWLAFDIKPWLHEQSKFPAWLNLAVGYGANNMLYAYKSINQANGYDTYRQYYVSLDVNFTRIPVHNKLVKSLFFILNTIHIPAPALEINKKGMKFHPLYF